MNHPPKVNSIRRYLGAVSPHYRGRIYASLREIRAGRGLDRRQTARNDRDRECLADAVFRVEDEVESRCGGQPDEPNVVAMRAARNRIYDDLRWNEYQR